MPEVRCTVSNCEFWYEGNVCDAPRILITAGPAAAKDKVGEGMDRLPRTPVEVAQDCYCWTFQPRQQVGEEDEDEIEAALPIPPLL
jgi:hypothetical protein